MGIKTTHVALVGNPNTGKSSIFNQLTGLHQKVGNYPGITVDKKEGTFYLNTEHKVELIDLPGTYSLNPTSADESVTTQYLLAHQQNNLDLVIVVTEVENLKRNLLIYTQVRDLNIPSVLVINMADTMEQKGIEIDLTQLEHRLNTKIVLVSTRKKMGITTLKEIIGDASLWSTGVLYSTDQNQYASWLNKSYTSIFHKNENNQEVSIKKQQHQETVNRYQFIANVLLGTYKIDKEKSRNIDSKIDKILTHKVFGYLIFLGLLLIMFQAIFTWAGPFMDGSNLPEWLVNLGVNKENFPSIDLFFNWLTEIVGGWIPEGRINDLITKGILPGIAGVAIFIPQITFLFLFIAVLEESGYMSRVVFLMDRIMRPFGLSGKSVVPLISGNACAVPAIMATRNIENWKERLITILIIPFTVCSARLPVYIILISLIIPEKDFYGIDYRALALLFMYVLGIFLAISASFILNKIIKSEIKSYFIIELPTYKIPLFKNVFLTIVEKVKLFVFNAGKIILAISIILWFLTSHGGEKFQNAEQIVTQQYASEQLSKEDLQLKIAAYQVEHSYIGTVGKTIEPVIRPLGYDWKIGIAILTSFVAREVFVGTLATIYSVEDEEDTQGIRDKMNQAVFADTGKKVFTLQTGVSLLLFYAIALQCASTVAIVKRETKSWKWTINQVVIMALLAYFFAFVGYNIL